MIIPAIVWAQLALFTVIVLFDAWRAIDAIQPEIIPPRGPLDGRKP